MAASIDDFKSKLKGSGARPNLFRVIVNYPAFAQGDSELSSFMISGASLPSSVSAPIIVPWRGRQAKFDGDRTFEPVSLTVINDTDMAVRNAFERWKNEMNSHRGNVGLKSAIEYQADIIIEQLDRAQEVVKTYTLRNAFPVEISAIELSADTSDTIENFTVSLEIDYWESNTTT